MRRLENKIILVTGGSGLIGSEIIRNVQINGGFSVNLDININTNDQLTQINCDITSVESINKTINLVIEKFGKIDGLVNNAYPRTDDWAAHFENININSWRENIDKQLNSVFILSQKVLVIMKNQKFGSIVNVASIYGSLGPDFTIYENTDMTMPAAYSAIKGGVINFSRYLSSYFGSYNIRVNCVSPGGIFNNQSNVFVENYEKKVPMKRMGLPVDIAPSVTFLLSDESSYITGQNLIIDGGWSSI